MNISDYRRDFAASCSAVELAHYQYRAGFEKELHLEPIYERYGDLFTLDAIDSLRRAWEDTPAHLETERAGLLLLTGSARASFLEARGRELTDEISRCEAAASVEWAGERVPINNVPRIISNEPSASRRRELAARWVDAQRSCNDLRATLIESFHESALALGFDSYRALFGDIMATDFGRLSLRSRQVSGKDRKPLHVRAAHGRGARPAGRGFRRPTARGPVLLPASAAPGPVLPRAGVDGDLFGRRAWSGHTRRAAAEHTH